jgi:Phosphotransferase enzyme family
VQRGLREAFDATEFEDIRRITRGQTPALVFRIVVGGSAYLLRIIMWVHSELGHARHFACMRAAAEAGLAPRVRYTSIEDGISITDFVEEVPFPAREALIRMPAVLRALHALPPFSGVVDHLNTTCLFLLHKGPALDGLLQKVQAAGVLPPGESEQLFACYAQVSAVYPSRGPDMVSSHNDLFKPDNILFDGDRVWLVDWEAAFLNDRYADLAVVANLLVSNDAEEAIYLREYFGKPRDKYQRSRFFLMQQVTHMFYAMVFLMLAPVNLSEKAPNFQAFQRRMWSGEVNLADKETKIVYGRVHLERLLQNVKLARFGEALRIVAERHRDL